MQFSKVADQFIFPPAEGRASFPLQHLLFGSGHSEGCEVICIPIWWIFTSVCPLENCMEAPQKTKDKSCHVIQQARF